MTWLGTVRVALDQVDQADAPRPFFFRDDDAGWRDDRLRAVLDCFQTHGVPVDVAVFPAELTPGLTRELEGRVRDTGVRVHQHGFAHGNHEPSGRKCEFGPARDTAAHARDIAEGQRLRWSDVAFDANDPAVKFRREMEAMFARPNR